MEMKTDTSIKVITNVKKQKNNAKLDYLFCWLYPVVNREVTLLCAQQCL